MRISQAHHQRLAELAPAALARLDAYGFTERREAAWVLITGALAPLFGFVVLNWPAAAVAVCLCLNLAVALASDWLRVLVAPSGIGEIAREATHDRFVFRVGGALARGHRAVNPKWTPEIEELDQPRMASEVLVLSPLGFGPALFSAWLIQNDDTLHAEPARLVIGTLPTALVVLGALMFAMADARVAWRRTGSVRMQVAGGNATLVLFVGMFTLMFVGIHTPDPLTTPEGFVVLACIAVASVGGWRLQRLAELRRTAAWLRKRLRPR